MFPAPAGINRRDRICFVEPPRVPRASGDKPFNAGKIDEVVSVFPAPAGINRFRLSCVQPASGVPRASGDKPAPDTTTGRDPPCSPRQRG